MGLVTSSVVMQEEQGQALVECSNTMQSITEKSNDINTCIGGTSVCDIEKAGRRADSVQSIENRKFMKQ